LRAKILIDDFIDDIKKNNNFKVDFFFFEMALEKQMVF
jgi:hypothetical protein